MKSGGAAVMADMLGMSVPGQEKSGHSDLCTGKLMTGLI